MTDVDVGDGDGHVHGIPVRVGAEALPLEGERARDVPARAVVDDAIGVMPVVHGAGLRAEARGGGRELRVLDAEACAGAYGEGLRGNPRESRWMLGDVAASAGVAQRVADAAMATAAQRMAARARPRAMRGFMGGPSDEVLSA